MPSRTLVSVDEYLHTNYDPDSDYVDGANRGEERRRTRSQRLQGEIVAYFRSRLRSRSVHAFPELRVQVAPGRFRIPDVSVVSGVKPSEQVLTTPPFIAIEILSKDDRMSDMQERIDDYLKFGVPYVWVINPRRHRAWVHTKDGSHEGKDGILRTENPEIELPLPEIFQALQ